MVAMGLWQTAWGLALAALVQLGGVSPPEPVMEGSGRSAYAIPSDGDTPILQFQTSTGDSVRLLIDTGASRSMVSRALIARPRNQRPADHGARGAGVDQQAHRIARTGLELEDGRIPITGDGIGRAARTFHHRLWR